MGRSIILGLELMIAGGIIRTVAVPAAALERIGALAALVAIRTFLRWSIEIELSGAWPWPTHDRSGGRPPQDLL